MFRKRNVGTTSVLNPTNMKSNGIIVYWSGLDNKWRKNLFWSSWYAGESAAIINDLHALSIPNDCWDIFLQVFMEVGSAAFGISAALETYSRLSDVNLMLTERSLCQCRNSSSPIFLAWRMMTSFSSHCSLCFCWALLPVSFRILGFWKTPFGVKFPQRMELRLRKLSFKHHWFNFCTYQDLTFASNF